MKKYSDNPRKVKSSKLNALHDNLNELGDLSGIVHDKATNQIICGNQRAKVLDINKCEIIIEHENKKPDEQGTLATGYVRWKNQKYFYRLVKWNKEQIKKACIIANISTGEWQLGDGFAAKFGEANLLKWGVPEEFIPAPKFTPEGDDDGEGIPEYPEGNPDISHIRMIQLHLNSETAPIFAKYEELLRTHYKTTNVGDTILNATNEIFIKLKREEA